MSGYRVGIGVDAHGFSDEARLVVGGVEFQYGWKVGAAVPPFFTSRPVSM